MTRPNIRKMFNEFVNYGLSFLETLNEEQLTTMIVEANNSYHTYGNPLITDNQYDIIKEYVDKRYPANVEIQKVGGAPITKNKVDLPYEMASMDKIKPDTNALSDWIKKYKGPYVISCKLDGVSGMYSTEGEIPKLYTRGDGKIGQDVSHLIPILKLPKHKGYVVRGEFIILKDVFNAKYRDKFANPRNMVAGIVNSKTIDEKTADLHFVVYELIRPVAKPSDQLRELGHEVVKHSIVKSLTNEMLSETLIDWRTNYNYEIDGIVVCDDALHSRASGNPKHAFAFKMVLSDQTAEAKVVDVMWTASKDGYLKPRVRIEPIHIGGVTIEYATGFNGKYIEDSKIGVGAIIQIIRSGDDIVLKNKNDDPVVREKNITGFFTEIGVDGLSSGNVKRIIAAGYDTVPKIIHMEKSDFAKIDGFQQKMVDKLYNGIKERLENATLVKLMVGSNMFGHGMGERKLGPVIEAYPDFLTSTETKQEKIKKLGEKGIHKNADEVYESIAPFLKFMKDCNVNPINKPLIADPLHNKSNPLYEKTVVMTKIRDKEIIEFLQSKGAQLGDTIKNDTIALIVKSKEDISNKTKAAIEKNVPIMTPEEFKNKYMA